MVVEVLWVDGATLFLVYLLCFGLSRATSMLHLPPQAPILMAAKNRDWPQVTRMVEGTPILARGQEYDKNAPLLRYKKTLLHYIVLGFLSSPSGSPCHMDALAAVTARLDCDWELDVKDDKDQTPLFIAVRGPVKVVEHLVSNGADPTIPNSMGVTPLIRAVAVGDPVVVDYLLTIPSVKNSIDSCTKDGMTALWCAARLRNAGTVERLLGAGANPTLPDSRNRTPLDEVLGKSLQPVSSNWEHRRCIALLKVS